MDRACGEPPQAATVTVAMSAASATETFRIMLRLGMRDSLPCRRLRWEGFAMVSGRKALEFREKETPMAIDPSAVGAVTEPLLFEWTDRDTLLYALGVGAGVDDLAFTTENSHGIDQQVLPTYAVICCPAAPKAGQQITA
ncbi:hypothetical protein MAHJHV51_25460 [Mycobacterium avium subsp. hominissuis]